MKWLVRIILITVTLLSLTVNGLLLVSQTGFQFISGFLNNVGLNTPVTSLQKSNADLIKKNSTLENKNKKIKRSINNYSKTRSKKMVLRASQKAANAATKSAAVFLPVLLGLVWLYSHSLVFIIGGLIASISVVLSFLIPHNPEQGNETTLVKIVK